VFFDRDRHGLIDGSKEALSHDADVFGMGNQM
jgi:hypothetical protein